MGPNQEIHQRDQLSRNFHKHNRCYPSTSLYVEGDVAGSDEDDRLNELRQAGICPNCGKPIPEGTAVVRGPGSFCTLDCVASFYQAEFNVRAKRLVAASRN
jgi:hypothetical protein